jgi:hypothetical protein
MRVLIAGLAALLFAGPAMAEPIPADVLERDRKACIASNPRLHGIDEKCTCIILSLSRDLTFQGYLTMQTDLLEKKASGASDYQASDSIPAMRNALRSCR